MVRRKTFGVFVCGTIYAAGAFAGTLPSSFTTQDFNALVALEAAQNEVAALVILNGGTTGAQDLGTWTGAVTDAGWNLGFVGMLDGTELSFVQTGTFDTTDATASWAATGAYGSAALSDSGSSAEDPSWLQQFIKIAATIAIGGTELATTVASGGSGAVFNVVASPLSVGIINKIVDDSSQSVPPPGTPRKSVMNSSGVVTDLAGDFAFGLAQTGTLDLDTGE